jgi:hypothetical protein
MLAHFAGAQVHLKRFEANYLARELSV